MGWNGSGTTSVEVTGKAVERKSARRFPVWAALLVGLSTAFLAVFVFLMQADSHARGEKRKVTSLIKDVKASKRRLTPTPRFQGNLPRPKSVEEALANVDRLPKPLICKYRPTNGEMSLLTGMVFKTTAEQMMSCIFTAQPGQMPIPFPPLDEEELKELPGLLISSSKIEESDSADVADIKDAVNTAKREMIRFIKEGGSANEFLEYYQNELQRAFELREMAIEQAQQLMDENPSLTAEFVQKVNEKLEDQGILRIDTTEVSDELVDSVGEKQKPDERRQM